MPVFCTYCGTQFTRDEHLERHILTHTNIKPFKCLTCHMSFARRDLLQRHYTVHGKNQDSSDGIPNILMPKHPGRTPIACTNCARTKTKCDKKFPCSRCAQRNLKCILRPTRRASRNVNAIHAGNGMPVNPESASGKAASEQPTVPIVQTATPEESNGNSPQPYPASEVSGQLTPQRNNSTPAPSRTPEPRQPDPSALFYEQCSSAAVSQGMPNLMSPLPTPGTIVNGYMLSTAMSGYEDLSISAGDGSDQSSPRFIMDWGQLQFSPGQFDPLGPADIMMATSMSVPLNLDAITDPNILMMPDFASMAALQTPMTTPRMSMSTCLSDLEIHQTALPIDTPPASSRQTSLSSDAGPGDLAPIIRAQDGWNCFRSAPVLPPASCPRTARLHLEKLEQSLKNHEGWNSWHPAWETSGDTSADHLHVVPLQGSSKDKLLAITQTFLHKALKTHKSSGLPDIAEDPSASGSSFVLLPPIRVLTHFLRAYANTFERLFPLTPRGTLDANALLADRATDDRASSLLTLLMLAAGALSVPSLDARWLQAGLTEACRISLFDLVETNVAMAADRTVLHSALLFTTTAAWSGDKWHMNMAKGQGHMYSAMLRHSGALEHDVSDIQGSELQPRDVWSEWLDKEKKSRLVYSWVMLDQDLSLFYDSNPLFAVTELGAPMPDSDRLWHANSATEWSTVFPQVHEFGGTLPTAGYAARPMSLRDLFRHFMEDDIIPRGMELTPLHLRLLLHPLQAMVSQHRQLSSCFSDPPSSRQQQGTAGGNVHAASARARADELRALLARWRRLADRYLASHPSCAVTDAALVVFHLVSLNAAANLPEVERLARGEGFDGSLAQLAWRRRRCLDDAEEALFHAGQALRLVRGMPAGARPPWWPGAVYRAGMVLWAESLLRSRGGQASMSPPLTQQALVAIDALPSDHPLIVRFRSSKRDGGTPVLARSDGSHLALDNEFAVLAHCVDIIDEGVANRFSDGIRNKLDRLARGS